LFWIWYLGFGISADRGSGLFSSHFFLYDKGTMNKLYFQELETPLGTMWVVGREKTDNRQLTTLDYWIVKSVF